ncbi:MAG: hypothetical protein ACP5JU_01345 [Minisyncoccia bacterium]
MFKILFRIILIFILIILVFAIVPKSFWDKIRPYFNWEVLFKTLKTGWLKFIDFLEGIFGFKFSDIPDYIKKSTGIDFERIFLSIKISLGNLFEKIANIFK